MDIARLQYNSTDHRQVVKLGCGPEPLRLAVVIEGSLSVAGFSLTAQFADFESIALVWEADALWLVRRRQADAIGLTLISGASANRNTATRAMLTSASSVTRIYQPRPRERNRMHYRPKAIENGRQPARL